MANISSYTKSRWLKKEDVAALLPAERRTTVDRVVEETVGDERKPVCYFVGIDKGWVINKTGLLTLSDITGSDETDNFGGAKVELFVDPTVQFQGKRIGGIKVRPQVPF